jgi:soluble lytic murein transglycosylase
MAAAPVPEALRSAVDAERVCVYVALERPRDALAAAADAIESAPDAPARRQAMQARYEIAWRSGEAADAVKTARRLFAEYAESEEAGAVAADLVERAGTRRLSNATLLASAGALAARNDTGALKRALRALDARALSDQDTEAHRMLWSEYHYLSGDYSRAIALARPSYADPVQRRASMLVMARSLRSLGKHREAAAMYEEFTRVHPNDRLAAEALYAAAALYRQARRPAEATRVLDQLRRSYPSTFHGWAAAMRRADELARAGSGAEAEAIYEQWLARSRRTDEAALYYLARERGRTAPGSEGLILAELRELNPYSFYLAPDVSASVRGPLRAANGGMRRDGDGSLSDWLARADAERTGAYRRVLASASDGPPAADPIADAALERGVLFLEAGLRDWGGLELDSARRRGGGSAERILRLARVYEEYAMPWRSVRLYERARSSLPWEDRRSHTEDFRFLTHPLPYPAQVLDNAARHGVPPHLVYGMIREESRFEADVVSRAGAVGLMQLMPETARRVAAQLDLSEDLSGQLEDPAVNVSIGVW